MPTDSTGRDSFPKLLFGHARERGSQPAIRVKSRGIWKTTSWEGFGAEVRALACALHEDGFGRGDRLALVAENRPGLFSMMAAAQCLGGVVAPLHVDASAEEIGALLGELAPTHVFVQDQEQVDRLLALLPACPSVRRIVFDEDRGMRHYAQPQLTWLRTFADRERASSHAAQVDAEISRGRGGDPAAIFCSLDDQGRIRAVVHTHASLIERASAAVRLEGLTPADVSLAYLPPAWIGQHLFGYAQSMVVGYCVACPESSETLLADLREVGPTWLFAPPRVLRTLLSTVSMKMEDAAAPKRALYERAIEVGRRVGAQRLSGRSLSVGDGLAWKLADASFLGPLRDVLGLGRVRVAYTAGESMDPDLVGFFRSIGVNLKRIYGSAEAGFPVAVEADATADGRTAGVPVTGVEVRCTSEGELLVRTSGIFLEYRGDAEATRRARDEQGWLRTGDAATIDERGCLQIHGRLADLRALADGSLFVPARIEASIKASMHVREAVAFCSPEGVSCALVVVDPVAAAHWADRQELAYSGYGELAALPEVRALIAEVVARANAALAADPSRHYAPLRRFAVLHRELSTDDGELARTGEVMRARVLEQLRPLVDAMAAGRPGATIQIEVPHEDGRTTRVPLEIPIVDVGPAGSVPLRRAA